MLICSAPTGGHHGVSRNPPPLKRTSRSFRSHISPVPSQFLPPACPLVGPPPASPKHGSACSFPHSMLFPLFISYKCSLAGVPVSHLPWPGEISSILKSHHSLQEAFPDLAFLPGLSTDSPHYSPHPPTMSTCVSNCSTMSTPCFSRASDSTSSVIVITGI